MSLPEYEHEWQAEVERLRAEVAALREELSVIRTEFVQLSDSFIAEQNRHAEARALLARARARVHSDICGHECNPDCVAFSAFLRRDEARRYVCAICGKRATGFRMMPSGESASVCDEHARDEAPTQSSLTDESKPPRR